VMAYGRIAFVLLLVLSPHLGILLLSFASIWSFSVLPDAYTAAHYVAVVQDSPRMIWNTVLYCGLAALIDVILGTAIAYLILRTRVPLRHSLDFMASAALAIPGVVLAIGYLRTFRGLELPFSDELITSSWLLLVVAYAVRRLPYALRACMAALQQLHVSLEEAAESLGATKRRTISRIVVPLMAGGILAGFVTSFMTAAVELSATIMLTTTQNMAPMSYGIYLYMQSAAGRGPGAALGVLAVLIVAFGTYLSHRFLRGRAADLDRQV
jgi:iron(III) transport system permease protein